MTHFISTTIPYVNGAPHIGHAQEFVLSDVLARFHPNTHFHSGADENSLKNVLAAEQAQIPLRAFVQAKSDEFQQLQINLGLDVDDFVRTSADPRHAPLVAQLWRACAANGDIYQKQYTGLYCVGCEQFYNVDELVAGRCAEHDAPVQEVEELNYFFRLSKYVPELIERIERAEIRIEPIGKRNEVLGFLRQEVQDISVSRSAIRAGGWGIEVPDDPSQIIYVWIDALANYVSGPGLNVWQDFDRVTHVVGKGVLRFHAVYWPAILLSAGWRLPDEILVHNYVTVEGKKIGKSLGNALDPNIPISDYGLDAFRYYLIRHVGCFRDGDFNSERYAQVYATELANQLGNLVSRLAKLLKQTPLPGAVETDAKLTQQVTVLPNRIKVAVDGFALHKAIAEIWQLVDATNAYLAREEPWKLEGEARLRVLASAKVALQQIAEQLEPFLPETATKIGALLTGQATDQLFPKLPRNLNA